MKKSLSLLLCFLLCLSPISCGLCSLFGRVMGANILSETEQKDVVSAIDAFEQHTGKRFVVVLFDETDDLLKDENTAENTLHSFLHSMIGKNSGMLYCIDTPTSKGYLITSKDLNPLFADSAVSSAHMQMQPLINAGQYGQAIISMIDIAYGLIPQSAIDEQVSQDAAIIAKTDKIITLIAEHSREMMRISQKQTDAAIAAAAAQADLLLACHSLIQEQIITLLNTQEQIAQQLSELTTP